MVRLVLTLAQWEKIALHCLGKPGDPGRSGSDNCRFIEVVLWTGRTLSPWRDLPAAFGEWSTVFKRFDDWSKAGVVRRTFNALSDDPDMEYAMIDATIAPVHRHGHGAQGGFKTRRSGNPKADSSLSD